MKTLTIASLALMAGLSMVSFANATPINNCVVYHGNWIDAPPKNCLKIILDGQNRPVVIGNTIPTPPAPTPKFEVPS